MMTTQTLSATIFLVGMVMVFVLKQQRREITSSELYPTRLFNARGRDGVVVMDEGAVATVKNDAVDQYDALLFAKEDPSFAVSVENDSFHNDHEVLQNAKSLSLSHVQRRRRSQSTATGIVTGFALVNVNNQKDVVSFSEGSMVNIANHGTSFTIRVITSGQVRSVIVDFDGIKKIAIDSRAPFTATTTLIKSLPTLALNGNHTISAQAFSKTNGYGDRSAKLTLNFAISGSTVDLCTFDAPKQPRTLKDSDVPAYAATLNGRLNDGEIRKWHKITLGFRGPVTCERAEQNPFTDYRLDVEFIHSNTGTKRIVPGYYAADGNAVNTGATSGNVWLVHFAPELVGTWTWSATFVTGSTVAQNGGGASAGFFDGKTGSFNVLDTNKSGRDHRGKGMLQYVGEHHLQFAGTGEWFLKAGPDSPENFLAYEDFDNTPNYKEFRKSWTPHVQDYQLGDPTWAGGRGKGIIGAINYLAAQGMNSFSFLTMSINGDDRNVFPQVSRARNDDQLRIDVSKTAQWEVLFEHADHLGMYLHFKTQEIENDDLLDGGDLGFARKLYYRELIARFGHHLALNWNLGEENTNTFDQLSSFSDYFKTVDPYKHPVVLHTRIPMKDEVYTPLLGLPVLDGISMQTDREDVFTDSLKWITESAKSKQKWVVANDEQGPATEGVIPDADDPKHDVVRKEVLWANLMAGGAGVEYYFGYTFPNSDVTCQDFRSRANMWALSRYALEFFANNDVPFWTMSNANDLVSKDNWCLADTERKVVVVYIKNGGTATINLQGAAGVRYAVKWYDPRNGGGSLQDGSVTSIFAGVGEVSLGTSPTLPDEDWVVLLEMESEPSEPPASVASATRLYHPDIVKVIPVTDKWVPGAGWGDSYSVGDRCYCDTTFDHGIGPVEVETPLGTLTVLEVCTLIGKGPGKSGRPVYNDIQCGNGPPNNAGDEDGCPGRVDLGVEGCGQIGPTWNFDDVALVPTFEPVLPSAVPTRAPASLPPASLRAGAFIESNGLVIMEMESEQVRPDWVYETDVPGYTGSGYYRMDGNTVYTGAPNGRTSFFIKINNAGSYWLALRSYKNNEDSTLSNDCYSRMVGHPGYQGDDTKTYMYGPSNTWRWSTTHQVAHDDHRNPIYTLSAGLHELQISGRARNFFIDRIVLYNAELTSKANALKLSKPESPRDGSSPIHAPSLGPTVKPAQSSDNPTAKRSSSASPRPTTKDPTEAPTLGPAPAPTLMPFTRKKPTQEPTLQPTLTQTTGVAALAKPTLQPMTSALDEYSPFVEENGLIVMEMESQPMQEDWVFETEVPGYTGSGYYRMNGNRIRDGDPNGRISYFMTVENPGEFRLVLRSHKNNELTNLSNDCYTKMVGHPGYQGKDTKTYMYGPSNTWSWSTMHEPSMDDHLTPVYTLSAGTHELQISGRAKNFVIDRIVLYNTDMVTLEVATKLDNLESPRYDAMTPQPGPSSMPTSVPLSSREPSRQMSGEPSQWIASSNPTSALSMKPSRLFSSTNPPSAESSVPSQLLLSTNPTPTFAPSSGPSSGSHTPAASLSTAEPSLPDKTTKAVFSSAAPSAMATLTIEPSPNDTAMASSMPTSSLTEPGPTGTSHPTPFVENPFVEANGLLVMEMESEPVRADWVFESILPGYTGTGYFRMDGNRIRDGDPNGHLSFFFQISKPGIYRLALRSSKNSEVTNLSNDCYTRMVGHPGYQGEYTKTYMYGPSNTWSWSTIHEISKDNHQTPFYTLKVGLHELQISGRAKNFVIDRIVLYHKNKVPRDVALDVSNAESSRAEGTEQTLEHQNSDGLEHRKHTGPSTATSADIEISFGELGGDHAVLSGDSMYFNDGNPLPTGIYRIDYIDGCMKYKNAGHGWTVNGADTDSGWWLVADTVADGLQQPDDEISFGNIMLPGTTGFTEADGAYVSFVDCVSANHQSAAPVTLVISTGEEEGGMVLGVRLVDARYDDNVVGVNSRSPRWSLTRVSEINHI